MSRADMMIEDPDLSLLPRLLNKISIIKSMISNEEVRSTYATSPSLVKFLRSNEESPLVGLADGDSPGGWRAIIMLTEEEDWEESLANCALRAFSLAFLLLLIRFLALVIQFNMDGTGWHGRARDLIVRLSTRWEGEGSEAM
eukprot:scaffold4140_cov178-Ochromonas_danica.AAC.10